MNLVNILSVISSVLPILVHPGTPSDTSHSLATKLSALLEVANGLQSPTSVPAIVHDIFTVVSGLEKAKVLPENSPVVKEALVILNEGAACLANYKSGQAAVIDHVSIEGQKGVILAVAYGGAAATSLGL